MCISLGDYDNDGWLDLYISDFQQNSDHSGTTTERETSTKSAIRPASRCATHDVLSFGGGFFDYDNDGWLDLFIANGHVYPEVEQVHARHPLQADQFAVSQRRQRQILPKPPSPAGNGFQTPYVGRGVAFADFDNDGFVDVVVGNNGDPPLLLRNIGGNGNHFVNFRLVGTNSNRDAMGARIRFTAGGITQIREIAGGGSYLSQSDLRANFGLGTATKIDSLEVTWLAGKKQSFHDLDADKFYRVDEGKSELSLQKFASHAQPKRDKHP